MAKETLEQKRARYYAAVDALLPYTESDFPAMGNRTPASIVDDAGPINDLKKVCEATVKTLNGIIDSKMMPGEKKVEGEDYSMTLVDMTQRKLDQTKAKEILDRLGVDPDEYMYDLDMTQHRYKKL